MARNATLSQIRTDVRFQADQVGATLRHPDANITRAINQSIQRFRERLSTEGVTHYLVHATGTLDVGATSPFAFTVLDLSAVSPGVVRTFGVDIVYNNVAHSLNHVPFQARNDYGGPQNVGLPDAWAHYQTRKVAILPPSDGAYTYVAWYLPVLDDLASDNDTFDGVSGWEEYIVFDVCLRLIARDQYPQAFSIMAAYAQDLWKDILRGATKVSSAGRAHVGRDTMGARYAPNNRRLLPEP